MKTANRKKLRGTAAALGAALLASVFSANAQGETLQEALVRAYQTNPTLLAERARLRATDESVSQAISGWRPTVVASGTYGTQETRTESSNPLFLNFQGGAKTTEDPRTAAITVTQPIFSGGRVLFGRRQADAQVMAGRESLRTVEQQLLLDVVSAYMDVFRDEAVVKLNTNNVQVLERQLQAARDRFEVGEITRTDVAQAEARLSGSMSNLTASEGVLASSRANYEQVVGAAPGTVSLPADLPDLPPTLELALEIGVGRNPSLGAARFAEAASRNAVKVAKGALLPTLAVEGRFQRAENTSSTVSRTDTSSVTAQLQIPLYQAGAEYSRVREAKQLNNQNRIQIAEAQRAVEAAITSAWENYRAAEARIVSDREQVRANEIAFEGVQQEAQVGSRTTLDVLDAEQELLDARVALVRTERDQFVAAYSLLSAIGLLSARDIGLPVDYYDPVANYDEVAGKWIGFGSVEEAAYEPPQTGDTE